MKIKINLLIKLSNYLDKINMKQDADHIDRLIIKNINKRSGQIPPGMHRSILQTGQFGESEYDELEWIRQESTAPKDNEIKKENPPE